MQRQDLDLTSLAAAQMIEDFAAAAAAVVVGLLLMVPVRMACGGKQAAAGEE